MIISILQAGILVFAVHGLAIARTAGFPDTSSIPAESFAASMIIGPSAVDEHDLTQRIISVWYARAAGFPPALSGDGSYTGIARLFPVPAVQTTDVKIRESIVAPANALQWKSDVRKSYIIPALEIPAFLFLLNMYDRVAYPDETQNGKKSYKTDLSTIWDNLTREHWVIDHDSFSVNQFSHPYQGTIHHGLARSAGLNFWESLLYANAGSFLWEVAGEATQPSINDQIATGTGGSFFGEALFRMSSLLLEGGGSEPGLWRELGAALISPATGFNRLAFGNRFKAVFPGRRPATFWSARLGVNCNSDLGDRHISSHINRLEPAADFSLAYGFPGRAGYSYSRPFDYFHFAISGRGSCKNTLESILVRGLLVGQSYAAGDNYRGIWGLYGGYDYISPYLLPVSSTSLSLGTTFQWWFSQEVALQGSVLGGIGYAAAGYLTNECPRNYTYGIAPQSLLDLRLILGDRAMLDFTDRLYYVSDIGGHENHRTEFINRLNAGVTVRLFLHHAVGLQYTATIRDAGYPDRGNAYQTAGVVSLFYTWLGDTGFGAVK